MSKIRPASGCDARDTPCRERVNLKALQHGNLSPSGFSSDIPDTGVISVSSGLEELDALGLHAVQGSRASGTSFPDGVRLDVRRLDAGPDPLARVQSQLRHGRGRHVGDQ